MKKKVKLKIREDLEARTRPQERNAECVMRTFVERNASLCSVVVEEKDAFILRSSNTEHTIVELLECLLGLLGAHTLLHHINSSTSISNPLNPPSISIPVQVPLCS